MPNHSYEANAHTAQMAILRKLLVEQSVSFSELVHATTLTNDHANFHIKKLVTAGLAEHTPKTYGQYRLTRKGKEYANRMDTEKLEIEKQPKLAVDICIESSDGKFLFQERNKQPYYGYWGFPTGKIRWGETMIEAAARELIEETGLTATLRVVGVHHKLDYDENSEILEDKYLILIHGTKPQGNLIGKTEMHTNYWLSADDFHKLDKRFDDIHETLSFIASSTAFMKESTHEYSSTAY